MLAILFAGLMAGAIHVVTGPDHLAAVAPLALSQRNKSWLLGVRWGLGHATGVILVAVLAWFFREILPVERYSSYCERLVGVMLIGIGLWALRRAIKFELHVHKHAHGGNSHQHIHAHHYHEHTHIHTHAALGVGILHGLAGGSHFLGVLPALAMPTRFAAAGFLVCFGIGTILAMTVFAFVFGMVGWRAAGSGLKYFKGAMATCASTAIGIGCYWLVF